MRSQEINFNWYQTHHPQLDLPVLKSLNHDSIFLPDIGCKTSNNEIFGNIEFKSVAVDIDLSKMLYDKKVWVGDEYKIVRDYNRIFNLPNGDKIELQIDDKLVNLAENFEFHAKPLEQFEIIQEEIGIESPQPGKWVACLAVTLHRRKSTGPINEKCNTFPTCKFREWTKWKSEGGIPENSAYHEDRSPILPGGMTGSWNLVNWEVLNPLGFRTNSLGWVEFLFGFSFDTETAEKKANNFHQSTLVSWINKVIDSRCTNHPIKLYFSPYSSYFKVNEEDVKARVSITSKQSIVSLVPEKVLKCIQRSLRGDQKDLSNEWTLLTKTGRTQLPQDFSQDDIEFFKSLRSKKASSTNGNPQVRVKPNPKPKHIVEKPKSKKAEQNKTRKTSMSSREYKPKTKTVTEPANRYKNPRKVNRRRTQPNRGSRENRSRNQDR